MYTAIEICELQFSDEYRNYILNKFNDLTDEQLFNMLFDRKLFDDFLMNRE